MCTHNSLIPDWLFPRGKWDGDGDGSVETHCLTVNWPQLSAGPLVNCAELLLQEN